MSASIKKAPFGVAAFAAFTLAFSLISPVYAQQATGCGSQYSVAAGDTLQSIAKQCNITVQQLIDANPSLNLQAGQNIVIPPVTGSNGNSGSNSGTTTGNNTGSNNGTTTGNNSGSTNNQVPVTGTNSGNNSQGNAFTMPQAPALANGQMYYRVFPGDTLSGIAAHFNTTIDNLLQLNPQIKDRTLIYTGQLVVVPVNNASTASNGQIPQTGSNAGNSNNTNNGTSSSANNNSGSTNSNSTLNSGSATTNNTTQYTVQSGETLTQIASRYNITLDQLVALNPNLVHAGTVINVPAQTGNNNGTGTTTGSNNGTGTTTGSNNGTGTATGNNNGTGTTTGSNANTQTYTVTAGDTLTSIASTYGITTEELLALNPNMVPAGTVINVPAQTGSIPQTGSNNGTGTTNGNANNPGSNNSSNANNTASNNNSAAVNASSIINGSYSLENNPNWTVANVYQKPNSLPKGTSLYKVQPGDSLAYVANKYNTTVSRLIDLNNNISPTGVIYSGEWLIVP